MQFQFISPMRALPIRCALLFLGMLIGPPSPLAQPCQYTYSVGSIQASGHRISVEVYEPKGTARHPLLMMIHGTAGVYTRRGQSMPMEDNFGEKAFAAHCFMVVLPHYFEIFGRSSITDLNEARTDFGEYRIAVQEILNQSAALPGAQGCPILLYGESFGGYLAVSLAFRDPDVLAVSESSGGLPTEDMVQSPRNSTLSLLIQHGADDSLVPSSAAWELEAYAVRHGAKVEKQIYAGQGHYFDAATRKAVLDRTLAFFQNAMTVHAPRFKHCQP